MQAVLRNRGGGLDVVDPACLAGCSSICLGSKLAHRISRGIEAVFLSWYYQRKCAPKALQDIFCLALLHPEIYFNALTSGSLSSGLATFLWTGALVLSLKLCYNMLQLSSPLFCFLLGML